MPDASGADTPRLRGAPPGLEEKMSGYRVETDSLEFWTKVFNIGLVPLLVALLGMVLALIRRRKRRAV